MKTTLTWFVALVLSMCGLFAIGGLLSSGCYYEVCEPCDCRDGGSDDDGGDEDSDIPEECRASAEEIGINAWIEGTSSDGVPFGREPGNYVSFVGSGQITPQAILDPLWDADRPPVPESCIEPLEYDWDFGGDQTATGTTPSPVSFSSAGYSTVTMTAAIAAGQSDLSPALLFVTVWDGTVFQDDFERDQLDRFNSGWSERISDALDRYDPTSPFGRPAQDWQITNQGGSRRLHSTDWGPTTTYCQPATQGVLTLVEATDARLSVRQLRNVPQPSQPHYSDIILRYRFNRAGATEPDASYYRARIMEDTGDGTEYCICLDLFKIDGENETTGGIGIEGSAVAACGNRLCGYSGGDNFFVSVEITGGAGQATIVVEVDPAPNAAAPWHSHTFVDNDSPLTVQGRFGVAQCTGETYFDDFRLERLN